MTISHALWIDLETTGLDFDTAEVLEVAAVLTEPTYPWAAIGEPFQAVIRPDKLDVLTLEPVVLAMHSRSGLLVDVAEKGVPLRAARDALSVWIRSTLGWKFCDDKDHYGTLRLAGSGVAHFDLHIIERRFKNLRSLLHYRTLDVSQIRTFAADVNIPLTKPEGPQSTEDKAHRALDDVLDHIAEARAYADQLIHVNEIG